MYSNLKELIINQINVIIQKRIDDANNAIFSAKESRDKETKSSVGDKYETGRAMVQFELEKHSLQLQKAIDLKNELTKINLNKIHYSVEFGSLVLTNKNNYFISFALGKIEIRNQVFYCISLLSPIGKLLYHKKENDKIMFQGNEFTITKII
jgi:hypothetical protein